MKPNLGYYRISQIDSKTIQEFINNLYVKHGFSKWYLKNILKVIKGSFKYAYYNLGYIPDNPAERVHIPKYDVVTGDPAHIFTQEEIERILERFKDSHSIYYSFLTAYYTGMRVSEVYALTWDCVDFENKTITINKNIIKKNQFGLPKRKNITKGHSVGVWYYGTCKNEQSRRTISIGDKLVKALKEYKKEQEENRKFYGDSYLKHYEKKVINEITNKEEILKIYNGWKDTRVIKECDMSCEENTTVYKFIMSNGGEYSIEKECDWLVINNKRYYFE